MDKIKSIINRFLKGNTTAFEELLDYFKPKIWAYLRQKIPMPDADDVFQDICLTVLTAIPTLEDKDRFLPWLFSITRFKIIDYHRNKSDANAENLLMEIPDETGGYTHDEILSLRELRQCIIHLEETYREAAILHFIAGFKVSEIAELLGVKINTVKSRIQRAKILITKEMRRNHEKAVTHSRN